MIVDAAVHPIIGDRDLRALMPKPLTYLPFPGPERYLYPVPGGEYVAGTMRPLPATGPAEVTEALFGEGGPDVAILAPLTRGMQQDVDLGSAICAAINRWQAELWLPDARFRGTIRVNPQDPRAAVVEIERWAGDSRFVQVGVPAQSLQPYGQRPYYPIWEAAAAAGLPVLIHLDAAAGVEFWPTPVGYPTHYTEFATMLPLAGFTHLISLVCEGVMERVPGFKVVIGDGGWDIAGPTLWRFDKSWRGLRVEAPGAARPPSEYVSERVRFVWHRWEGPSDRAAREGWAEVGAASRLTLYGGNYPGWDYTRPPDAGLDAVVLGENAVAFYGDRLA